MTLYTAWYVVDAKTVWTLRKIVSVQSFYIDSRACVRVKMM